MKTCRHRCVIWSLALLLGAGLCLAPLDAASLPGQDGLPPELIIADSPALPEQAQALSQMATWLTQNQPKGGGFLGGLKGFFGGGSGQPTLVNLPDLLAAGERVQGKLIAVQGVYVPGAEKDKASLQGEGVVCLLSLAPGLAPQGLPAGRAGLPVRAEGVAERLPSGVISVRVQKLTPAGALTYLRLGRVYELQQQHPTAVQTYRLAATLATKEAYVLGAFGAVRAAQLTARPPQPGQKGEPPLVQDGPQRKLARGQLSNCWNLYTTKLAGQPVYFTWVPTAEGTWRKLPVGQAIAEDLRELEQESFWYSLVQAFVTISGGNAGIGLVLLAIVTRLLLYPLTKKQLASAKEMQALQPEMKRLQEKFKGDKQKFQEEFWKLCQERGVNPLGGCLPLLLQMPLLYFVYMGIRAYIVNLDNSSFLWVHSLAQPDIPMLVIYTVSQIAFGKLTQSQNPAAMDPQQKQQQQMMTYMMPLMFFFLFQKFPAAFMLYWLATNLAYIAQQMWFNKTHGTPAAVCVPPEMGDVVPPVGKTPPGGADKSLKSFEERRAASEGKLISKQEAEKRRSKKRRWTRR